MQADKLGAKYSITNNKLEQSQLSEIQVDNAPPNNNGNIPDHIFMVWGPIGLILSWAALFLMLSKRGRIARNEIAVNIKSLNQIPCKNCKFFANNPHLKCAIHPSLVLTEKAIDCSDYCQRDRKSA